MEEDKLNGMTGIDLDTERDRLNYRPQEYVREVERRGDSSLATTATEETSADGNRRPGITYILEQVLTYDELLKQTKKRLFDLIGDTKVSLPEGLAGLAAEYGLSDGISAKDFERLFAMRGDGGAEALSQIWELYAEDVDGNLAMEYLEDIFEMEQNLQQAYRLIDEVVLPLYGIERTTSDDFLVTFEKAENERLKSLGSLTAELEKSKAKLRAHVINHDILEEAIIKDASRLLRKRHSQFVEQDEGVAEAMDIVSTKLKQEYRTLVRLNTNLDDTRLTEQSYVDAFLPMVEDEETLKQLVRKGKGVLKLSVDRQLDEKARVKTLTRNHLSLTKRERVQRAYMDESELSREWVSDWRFLMMEQETTTDAVDEFFDAMAIGMVEVEERRRKRAVDLYQMQLQEALARKEKIDLVSRKETAREGYRQMTRHLENM